MELFKASTQWSQRPDDERFESVQQMRDACFAYYQNSRTSAPIETNHLKAVADGTEVVIEGSSGRKARMTNWGFKQICQKAGAPPSYLAELPARLAADNLNHGLQHSDGTTVLLLNNGDSDLIIRAATSEQYERFWNWEVCDRLLSLPSGWRVPPARPCRPNMKGARPATEADVLSSKGGGGLSVSVGDMIAPAGLYASDHDMFAFFINEEARIDDGTDEGISRGFMMGNSEVGASSWWMMMFGLRHVCGNHIVWGARDVSEVRLIHKGGVTQKAERAFRAQIIQYANESATFEEARIKAAKTFELAKTKDELLDMVFGRRILTKKNAEAAYELAEKMESNPRSAWGFANGVTRLSQMSTQYADKRYELDRAAGKVLQMAF